MFTLEKKGFLIAFEGIDGSGKTSQCKMLKGALEREGLEVATIHEPTNSKWGMEIRESVQKNQRLPLDRELELFILDRKENVQKNIIPALKTGKTILLDRYYFSTIAYQGARGADAEEIKNENEKFAPQPDIVYFIDVSVRTAIGRIEKRKRDGVDRSVFEVSDYLEKVRNLYLTSLKNKPYCTIINGEQDPHTVHKEILDTLRI